MRHTAIAGVIGTGIVLCGSLMAAVNSEPPSPAKQSSQTVVQTGSPAVSVPKPDLVIEKVQWTTAPDPSGGTQVSIAYTVFNNGPVATRLRPTAAGRAAWSANPVNNWLFMCSSDMRELPNGTYPPPQGGIALELGAHQRMTVSGGGVVPAGKRVEFRVTADSLNWVDESNETNNTKAFIWPPPVPLKAPIQK